ncbi:MAG: DUF932 domain-containing protein [Polaromonas sp.]|uniref:DUF932 domain-containing protein n=1 Tax=Polaromonas sp. TaxID=1869339 RepID=UPI0025E9AAD0|nr:DUF932 domain-containing protein [Polaromonas sp.]MBI2727157.1 DUF932 domain-containing protein [Polaromonas sp.]
MSHEINSIAYVGEKPWHGLGNILPKDQPIEVWAKAAGMEWHIQQAPLEFKAGREKDAPFVTYEGQQVLYRSDTLKPLSVVSKDYHLVQPKAVLEFFRGLVETQGYELETAGCLRGGRRFWALARMREVMHLPGDDSVEGYLLLATSCDGTLATSVIPTSIRVVCQNTLHATLENIGIRIPHSRAFDAEYVKSNLGMAKAQWESYVDLMTKASRTKITKQEAIRFFQLALHGEASDGPQETVKLKRKRALEAVQRLYDGAGKGAALASSKNTVWGALNALTQFSDHERKTRTEDTRLSSAWFGAGARLKQNALEFSMFMVDQTAAV